MYLHPRMAVSDIRKERDVVIEEIMMGRDHPQQQVDDLLGELLWSGHALGRPLTGSPESVKNLYRSRHYVASNTVIAFAGKVDHADCVAHVKALFRDGEVSRGRASRPVDRRVPQKALCLKAKQSEQVHLAMGFRLFGRHDRRRHALRLLSIILGENMSSRLFQVVREQYGLAYAIQAGMHLFHDTGALMVTAGLDRARLDRALHLIVREVVRMRTAPVSKRELERARDYAVGQLRLGLEGTSSQMMWIGEHLLTRGRLIAPEESQAGFEAVTVADVYALAQTILRPSLLSVAMLLPDVTKELQADTAKIFRGLEETP